LARTASFRFRIFPDSNIENYGYMGSPDEDMHPFKRIFGNCCLLTHCGKKIVNSLEKEMSFLHNQQSTGKGRTGAEKGH
jgi:hypothetical protein